MEKNENYDFSFSAYDEEDSTYDDQDITIQEGVGLEQNVDGTDI